MEQLGYGEFIAGIVKNLPYESAIQTEDIAEQLAERFALPNDKARKLTNVKLKRMADNGEIERLQKGILPCERNRFRKSYPRYRPNGDENANGTRRS